MSKYIEGANVALNVLEAIRATNPELIADNMRDGWGMNKLRAVLAQPQATEGRRLCVDGHEFPDSESNWAGDGQFPPFAVFDIDAQENLLPYYLTRKQAEAAMDRLMENIPPTTELAYVPDTSNRLAQTPMPLADIRHITPESLGQLVDDALEAKRKNAMRPRC